MKNSKTENLFKDEYKYGFESQITSETFPPGLNEEIVTAISKRNEEPEFLCNWRINAFRYWQTLNMPTWAKLKIKPIDYQKISYFSTPLSLKKGPKDLSAVDPEIIKTYQRLGIPLKEQKRLQGVAVDAIFDSVSVTTTFQEKLSTMGIIFCSFSQAVKNYPKLVKKYLGSVVSFKDNFFAALNAAVFSDGSFVYIPQGVRSPIELSSYFRINSANTGQFERTLIIADKNSYVSYLEGCSAPMRDENQLHAAVVELIALDDSEIKYSTVQNWYPGDKSGRGGIYNFVTKRGLCSGKRAKISWTQVEVGSAITWKYPSTILKGDASVSEFNSVALTNNYQQADSGTKMIHLGRNTKSTIIAKSIATGFSQNSYRSLVYMGKNGENSKNYTQCDSLLLGDRCGTHTFPTINAKNRLAKVEHEASTTKVSEEKLFYLQQRGIDRENALIMVVNGFCKSVFKKLPLEFAVEVQKLIEINLEDFS